jgi:membrane protease YdiL (CAAX protease family)
MISARAQLLLEALLASAAMVFFGLFVHSRWPWGLISDLGLAAAALAVLLSLRSEETIAPVLGLASFGPRVALLSPLGVALGVGLGSLFRWHYGLHWFSGAWGTFAPVAIALGAVEELFYRGYLQGRLNQINGVAAVFVVAAAHAAYKTALLLLPALSTSSRLAMSLLGRPTAAVPVNLATLALGTFLGGLLFGVLRQAARNVAPSLAAHAAFDVVVYGELANAPWWVWN